MVLVVFSNTVNLNFFLFSSAESDFQNKRISLQLLKLKQATIIPKVIFKSAIVSSMNLEKGINGTSKALKLQVNTCSIRIMVNVTTERFNIFMITGIRPEMVV